MRLEENHLPFVGRECLPLGRWPLCTSAATRREHGDLDPYHDRYGVVRARVGVSPSLHGTHPTQVAPRALGSDSAKRRAADHTERPLNQSKRRAYRRGNSSVPSRALVGSSIPW